MSSLLRVENLGIQFGPPDRSGKGRRWRFLCDGRRRDPGRGGRKRQRQKRHRAGADAAARLAARALCLRQHRIRRARRAATAGKPAARLARKTDRLHFSGAGLVAQSGLHHRLPDSRGDRAAPARGAGRRRRKSSPRSTASASANRPSGWTIIRTSSAAACSSAS